MTDTLYNLKFLFFASNIANTIYFLLISLTCLVVDKALTIVKLFDTSFFFVNYKSILQKMKIILYKNIFILILASNKIF